MIQRRNPPYNYNKACQGGVSARCPTSINRHVCSKEQEDAISSETLQPYRVTCFRQREADVTVPLAHGKKANKKSPIKKYKKSFKNSKND